MRLARPPCSGTPSTSSGAAGPVPATLVRKHSQPSLILSSDLRQQAGDPCAPLTPAPLILVVPDMERSRYAECSSGTPEEECPSLCEEDCGDGEAAAKPLALVDTFLPHKAQTSRRHSLSSW